MAYDLLPAGFLACVRSVAEANGFRGSHGAITDASASCLNLIRGFCTTASCCVRRLGTGSSGCTFADSLPDERGSLRGEDGGTEGATGAPAEAGALLAKVREAEMRSSRNLEGQAFRLVLAMRVADTNRV